jgi:DNA polymerase alpha subunit A
VSDADSAKSSTADPCARSQYSDSQLYNQLLFFDTLFDVEKARSRASGTAGHGSSYLRLTLPRRFADPFLALAETVTTLAEANKITLAQLRAVVTKHLDKNGRRWVSMSALFSFVKI